MELDFQTALLLQYKLEQEDKRKEDTTCDHQLAKQLQDQFNTEEQVERSSSNLVYKAPTNPNRNKCLVDPSWEVIDPTPDIHILFTAFDQRFFWSSLGSVTVSWSKRMTTCAGVCSYQGRGGLCSITLSEPLLKLRPRKDLVETLLHEMIHAYLFVTNNNRDRDGHGPEFHSHMYRINAETGTNITVYHDFHDEVRLYQQHWWRCNGPCQHWHPYFGTVRRATNRPPGPNDRWWNDHLNKCGGNFVKVKSPEALAKPSKTTKSKQKANFNTDIRKYVTPITNSTSNIVKPSLNPHISVPTNIHTVSNESVSINQPQISNVIPTESSNIFGFTNLQHKKQLNNTYLKKAGTSTFVVTKTDKASNKENAQNHEVQPFSGPGRSLSNETKASNNSQHMVQPFTGPGRSLSISSSYNSSYLTVREHWLKKFGESSKRPNSFATNTSKRPKHHENRVKCPICSQLFKSEDLNPHLDECLDVSSKHTKECIICTAVVAIVEYEQHLTECSQKHFEDVFEEDKSCPACNVKISQKDFNLHLKDCNLGLCNEFDDKYASPYKNINSTQCLACGKEIRKTDLNKHLEEECLGVSGVFDSTKLLNEDDIKEGSSFNCPFCMKVIEEGKMKRHIDGCLKQDNAEMSSLIESICEPY
ncbi:DNA-dependent metalloprotease SPRTN [Euwallacea fornicatus]|uniref:DNA-dependent metalloprotease SPRTN n=1 Tax=Euwallacea fornicatus TaxID=995702 RepID=UPI00339027D9